MSKDSDSIMGAGNQITEAKQILERELHFRIASGDTEFLSLFDRAGKKRFDHCVELVKLWARPHHNGRQKYDFLMSLMLRVTPEPIRLRNKQAEAWRVYGRELDKELEDVLRREP